MKIFFKKNEKGFTLMELLVSTSIFTIVAVGGLSVLLSSQRAYKRISSNRIAVDNINMVIDTMSREIKFGSRYGCINTSQEGSFNRVNNTYYNSFDSSRLIPETNGLCNAIAFTPQGTTTKKIVYYFDTSANSIREVDYTISGFYPTETFSLIPNSDLAITSQDFKVEKFWIIVAGIDTPTISDFVQSRVDISISGIVDIIKNNKGEVVSTSTISIQTTIAQRLLDN